MTRAILRRILAPVLGVGVLVAMLSICIWQVGWEYAERLIPEREE